MTNRQKELTKEAIYLQKRIRALNAQINLLQQEYIEVANKLFDSIEDKKETKGILNNESELFDRETHKFR